MAATPQWKVYNTEREYVAACKHLEDAACLVALYGDGATVRGGHSLVLWCEGTEDQPASESYDHVREVCERRVQENLRRIHSVRAARGWNGVGIEAPHV